MDRIKSSSKQHIFAIGIVVVLLLSILPRLFYLDKMIWWWRPAQTLLTTYWFIEEGIDLIDYQTPLFGGSWQVPFEFPLYQAVSAWFAGFSLFPDITAASRVVSLIAFYASAFALLALVQEYTRDKLVAFIVFLVYLWHPYNIYFSIEPLIDFSSVAFALGYIYLFIKWMRSPSNWLLAVVGIVAGILGALMKITTMAIVVVPIVIVLIKQLQEDGLFLNNCVVDFWRWSYQRLVFLFSIVLYFLIPVMIALLWTRYSDGVKSENPLTVWLMSGNLNHWNYGTWEQKTSLLNWAVWIFILNATLLYDSILVFLVLGGLFIRKAPKAVMELYVLGVFGSFFTLFTFFNLYRHEYYWIALSPYVCMLVGLTIYACFRFAFERKKWWTVVVVLLLVIVGVDSFNRLAKYQRIYLSGIRQVNARYGDLADTIQAEVSPDGYFVAIQTDWYPELVFMAERKGMIVHPNKLSAFNCQLVAGENYQAIAFVEKQLTRELKKILSCFPDAQQLSPQIYLINSP